MAQKNLIFNIAGGLGKNIMATAVARAIKEAYPDSRLVVSSPHREVWLDNPRVAEIVNLETTPNFQRDYIEGKNALVFRYDPYLTENFIYRREHLTKIWCDLCGVPYSGEKPELYFTTREKEAVQKMLSDSTPEKIKTQPLFFLQTNGGAPMQTYPISWARDLPLSLAEKIVTEMNHRGYRTIHLRRNEQPAVPGAECLALSHRQVLCAIQFSEKRLFIDSFAQHTAAAFNLPSTVVWIVNSPKVFGYQLHHNLLPTTPEEFRHHPNSYLEQYDITGRWEECPYANNSLFDPKQILDSLLQ